MGEAAGVVEIEKASPHLHLPASVGGGKVYKRTIVAELNKVRPRERISLDRLTKVRDASSILDRSASTRANPNHQPQPASSSTNPTENSQPREVE